MVTSPPRRAVPGAYRQDVVPAAPPAFRTGVPAFLGAVGGTGPRRLTRAGDVPDVPGYLSAAVRGFFGNGGTHCYLLPHTADASSPGAAARAVTGALAALDDQDDVDLVCLPDLVATPVWAADAPPDAVVAVQRAVLDHCAGRGDRFAVLDAVPSPDPAVVGVQRDRIAGPAGSFGALYHPWLGVVDAGGTRFVPPCGHVAGVYAAGDDRVGVHKAPAGDTLTGVVDLAATLSDAETGTLYAGGVNCLRARPGRGIRVWGARTLSDDPAWRDVSVRRVVAAIGRWIERFMLDLVHEPNDVRLWVRIMRELTAYLEGLHQRGALKGRTAEESFFVKCDNETNPPAAVDAGTVVTQVGVAPTVPAEFIVVRVVQDADGVTVHAG